MEGVQKKNYRIRNQNVNMYYTKCIFMGYELERKLCVCEWQERKCV